MNAPRNPRSLDPFDICSYQGCVLTGPHSDCQSVGGYRTYRPTDSADYDGFTVPSYLLDYVTASIKPLRPPTATTDPSKASVMLIGGKADGRLVTVPRPVPPYFHMADSTDRGLVGDGVSAVEFRTLTYARTWVTHVARDQLAAVYVLGSTSTLASPGERIRIRDRIDAGALTLFEHSEVTS